jgi:hypothetical protein
MTNHGLDLLHRPDLPALIARWYRAVTPAELRAGYESILVAADAAGCARWLLDLRRREDLTEPTVNTWFGDVFGQPVMAIVSAATTDCEIATFTDEAAAHAWLARKE